MSSPDIVASRYKTVKFGLSIACLIAAAANAARADGVTAYLPLNLEPEAERQIERVLILADEPVLKRPFAVALVQLALPKACERDKALCIKVKKYLERYSGDYAVTHASATGSKSNGADVVLPNQHGETSQSDWEISAQGFVQPSDYFLASAGVIAYSGRTVPTGSMLSFGFNWAQVDVGFIGQNVYLFCASEGLGTVVRASVNRDDLGKALNLRAGQRITLAQSVGYAKKSAGN